MTEEPEYVKHMFALAQAKVLWFCIGVFAMLLFYMLVGATD